jgi:hypothetical protein
MRFLGLSVFKCQTLCASNGINFFKSDVWLNFNKLSSKATFFKCQTHFLHSSKKKRAGIPRILVTGEYFCLLFGNFHL